MPDDRPEYKVYRSRPRILRPLRRSDLRRPDRPERLDGGPPPRRPDLRRSLRPGRLLRILLLALLGWVLVSGVIFFVSAELQRRSTEATQRVLSDGGSFLTGSTILVLGSDARPEELAEPGSGGAPRADSIMLLRAGFGRVRRVSVLRDSYAQIPGHGTQKINAAYAIGGPSLAVETVEGFVGHGLRVNHLVEVSFGDFAALVDALGGIDVTLRRCVSSDPFGGRRFRLRRGEHHLNGRQALAFARVRKNRVLPQRGRPGARPAPAAGHVGHPGAHPVAGGLRATAARGLAGTQDPQDGHGRPRAPGARGRRRHGRIGGHPRARAERPRAGRQPDRVRGREAPRGPLPARALGRCYAAFSEAEEPFDPPVCEPLDAPSPFESPAVALSEPPPSPDSVAGLAPRLP